MGVWDALGQGMIAGARGISEGIETGRDREQRNAEFLKEMEYRDRLYRQGLDRDRIEQARWEREVSDRNLAELRERERAIKELEWQETENAKNRALERELAKLRVQQGSGREDDEMPDIYDADGNINSQIAMSYLDESARKNGWGSFGLVIRDKSISQEEKYNRIQHMLNETGGFFATKHGLDKVKGDVANLVYSAFGMQSKEDYDAEQARIEAERLAAKKRIDEFKAQNARVLNSGVMSATQRVYDSLYPTFPQGNITPVEKKVVPEKAWMARAAGRSPVN